MSAYQSFLKSCNCDGQGFIFKDNIPVCRWCREPYGKAAMINYEDEHFKNKATNQKEPPIDFVQPGDVIGCYQETGRTDPDSVLVWKHNQASKQPLREYEILEYSHWQSPNQGIDKDSMFWGTAGADVRAGGGQFNIKSVKRISDGEVFSVGEKEKHIGEIKSISYSEKYPLPHDITLCGEDYRTIFLRYAEKVKQPVVLFVTEDNFEVFAGDKVYGVAIQASSSDVIREKVLPFHQLNGLKDGVPVNRKWFKEMDNAMEYAVINTPVLSVNNVIEWCDVWFSGSAMREAFIKELKELAKSKIDNP